MIGKTGTNNVGFKGAYLSYNQKTKEALNTPVRHCIGMSEVTFDCDEHEEVIKEPVYSNFLLKKDSFEKMLSNIGDTSDYLGYDVFLKAEKAKGIDPEYCQDEDRIEIKATVVDLVKNKIVEISTKDRNPIKKIQELILKEMSNVAVDICEPTEEYSFGLE